MVLVQVHANDSEHVIYYLSKGRIGPELQYLDVEKLSLAVVFAVTRLRHYILMQKTVVISLENLM